MRDLFDEIYNSVVNGQHKQALCQFSALSGGDRVDCIDYIWFELEQPEIVLKLTRNYVKL